MSAGDKLLIVDDFLANGCALQGLISIAEDAGETTGFLIGTCALLIIKNEYIARTLALTKRTHKEMTLIDFELIFNINVLQK